MAATQSDSNIPNSDSQSSNSGPPKTEDSTYQTEQGAYKFCETFAKGLETGMDYSRIFEILERQGIEKRIIDKLKEALFEKGDSLGDAFTRFGLLDSNARQLLNVAEKQGNIPQTFDELAEMYKKRHERKKNIVGAFIMPAIIFAIGGIIFVYHFLLKGGIIKMAQEGLMKHAPGILLNAGINIAIFFLICGTIAYIFINFPIDSSIRETITNVWMRIPFLSKTGRERGIALFSRYLSRAIGAGMSVFDGLELAADASNHPHIQNGIEDTRRSIEQGNMLKVALKEIDDLPQDVIDHVDIGEETGELEGQLEKLADRYEKAANERFERRQETFSKMLLFSIVAATVLAVFYTLGTELMTKFTKALGEAS